MSEQAVERRASNMEPFGLLLDFALEQFKSRATLRAD